MEQYIDKDALVAKINALLDDEFQCNSYDEATGFQNALTLIEKFIDTLEVKEVDLDTDFGVSWGEYCDCGGNINDYEVAKHFFELGLRSTITEEDCKLIWNIGDDLPYIPEEDFFKELLKRYKAQKGEEV